MAGRSFSNKIGQAMKTGVQNATPLRNGSAGGSAQVVGESPASGVLPTVPDHELLRRIGGGSYGEVWLARNVLGEFRAVKVIYRQRFEHDRPFEREFEGIQKFEPISRAHPSQLNILHVGRNDPAGYFYYVMELADDAQTQTSSIASGARVEESPAPVKQSTTPRALDPESYTPHTLKLELYRHTRLPLEECISIGLSLSTAVEHLHANGLVHRDIKPSNIVFVKGTPKLADIGLVASMDATMSFVGTSGFLPPEGPGTPQGDIYSLGKVLYEISMGRDRQEFPKLPTDLAVFGESVERLLELNAIVLKACAHDPRQRYQSAQELAADLALLPSGRSVRQLRAMERRLAIATKAGIALGAAALLAFGAYFGAVRQAQRARRAEMVMARNLYASDIGRAMQFWERGNFKRALELLEAHRPGATAENQEWGISADLRGFEWFYLWRLCHKDQALETFRLATNQIVSADSPDLSPGGTILAAESPTGILTLWDVASRLQIARLLDYAGDDAGRAFLHDGKLLAYRTKSGSIALWDIVGRRPMASFGTAQRIYCLALSSDGKLLAVVEPDSTTVTLWDVGSRLALGRLKSEDGGWLYGVEFSPDGKILVGGHDDYLITFWDVSTHKKIADMAVPVRVVGNLFFSPDGKTLAVAGMDPAVVLCDVESRTIIGRLIGHESDIVCVAFSPDGRTIATGSIDNTVRLWSALTGQTLAILKGHLGLVADIAFSPDGKKLVSVDTGGTIKVWETAPLSGPVDGEEPQDLGGGRQTAQADILRGHTHWARSLAFSPDGQTLASGSKDKTIKFWDVASGQLLGTMAGHRRSVIRLAWSPDGRFLASVGGLIVEPNGLGEVKLWDPIQRKEVVTLTNQNSPVCSVAFSSDSQKLATGDGTGAVALWDVITQRQITTLFAHSNQVRGLAFSPDGKWLASGGDDNSVKLWRMPALQESALFHGSPGNTDLSGYRIWCLAFSRDSQTLAVGNDDGTVTLWSVLSKNLVGTLKGTTGRVWSIAFSPDGKTLVTSSEDSAITLWQLATGQEMLVLKGHAGFVESVACSPDGSVLASAGSDKTVLLWRSATRAEADTPK